MVDEPVSPQASDNDSIGVASMRPNRPERRFTATIATLLDDGNTFRLKHDDHREHEGYRIASPRQAEAFLPKNAAVVGVVTGREMDDLDAIWLRSACMQSCRC